ncbi:MAG: hypothetical protein GF346_05045 [Candidatus Eisenbacteria bacterium]|nr:hypothetical protein [Candidatus Latescibacterota bacterium]MBD3301792.1 hypothetical protein [Candidatus Eisenbacteria bacterium]
MSAGNGAEAVRWNLGRIYEGPEDPAIRGDEEEVDRRVERFQRHRGVMREPDVGARKVREVVEELEQIRALSDRLVTYAALAASADQRDRTLASLYARLEERHRLWSAKILFAELDLRRLPAEALQRLIDSSEMARYRHFLEYQSQLAPHTLSEGEEQVAMKKNIAGRDAQVRFREEQAAQLDFGTLRVDGEDRPMTMASLVSLQEHPDPEVRFAARDRLNRTYRASRSVFAFLYGNVVKDQGIETDLRSFAEPIEVENVPNEIPGPVVRNLLDAGRRHLGLLHEYYRWKADKLGVARLRTCDLAAPLPGAKPDPIPWDRAQELVIGGFRRISPEFAEEVGRFFEEERIDAGPRPGKRGGAFCASVPGRKPHVLMNYTGTVNTMITLAHELGHGIHFVLSGEAQPYLQAYNMSKVIAEVASEFGECLLRDHLLETSEDESLKRKLLVSEVERFTGVIYRQLFYTEFELAAHARAAEEPLTADSLDTLWAEKARAHYGPHVELLESDVGGWSIVGHFVFNPFYCYSYALSQVVVLALYRKWKEEGDAFLPRYLDLLRGGWSGTPERLLAQAGIDLRDSAVLDEAFREFGERVRLVREAFDRET